MKVIINESQLILLNKQFLKENGEFNEYGLTDSEMNKVEKQAEKESYDFLEDLKKNIREKQEYVDRISDFDFSQFKDESMKDLLIKDYVMPMKKELEQLKKNLEEFNFEERKKRIMDWHIYSAGGLGWSFRYNRYREEALNRNLTKEDIIDLFVTALEGGSNHWYYMDLPDDINSYGQSTSEAVGEFILQGGKIYFYDVEEYERVIRNKEKGEYDIQGDVIDQKSFDEDIDETYLGYVDMDHILEAITIIKKDYPEIWERILLEQEDSGDADVFLQLCVMGDVVYG